MIWLLLIPAVLAVALVDLLLVRRGGRWHHPNGFTFYTRRGSWLNLLIWADGVTIGDTIHFRRGAPRTSRLLAHEIRHIEQIRQDGTLPFLWAYITHSDYRRFAEADATTYADYHWNDPWIRGIWSRVRP